MRDKENAFVRFCLRHDISANAITFTAISCIPILDYLLYIGLYEPAVILMLAIMFSDVLDGMVARAREDHLEGSGITPLGEFFDPMRDKLLIVSALYFMTWVPRYVFWTIAVAEGSLVLVRIAQFIALWLRGMKKFTVPSTNFGKRKTLLECIATVSYLLQVCRPEYVPLLSFCGAIPYALASLTMHTKAMFQTK